VKLCDVNNRAECDIWRVQVLKPYFKQVGVIIDIPADFPNFDVLQYYNRPKATSKSALQAKLELGANYRRQLLEKSLLRTTSHLLNYRGMDYMRWVGPTLLTRFIVEGTPSVLRQNVHEIKRKKRELKKNDRQPTITRMQDLILTFWFDDLD
jgi:hypothetical protein